MNIEPYFPILAGMAVGAVLFLLFLVLASYVFTSLAVMAIAKKTKTDNAWLAWIPVANLFLLLNIAEVPLWHAFAILLAFIPGVGSFILLAATAYWWWKISERLKRPGWWGIIIAIIPLVNFVFMGLLAWSDK